MAIRLGPNQYGKAEVRAVVVDRSSPRHTLVDLNVCSSLRGDVTAAHTAGDDTHVLAGLRDLVVLKTTGSEFRGSRATGTPSWPRPASAS